MTTEKQRTIRYLRLTVDVAVVKPELADRLLGRFEPEEERPVGIYELEDAIKNDDVLIEGYDEVEDHGGYG